MEALWDRGVEAWGIDISEYPISQVRRDMALYCRVASLTEPIADKFDLIVCIEVLEHLAEDEARLAIANLAAASDTLLFPSTPTDFDEATHVNVRPTISWIRQFAEFGLIRMFCSTLASSLRTQYCSGAARLCPTTHSSYSRA